MQHVKLRISHKIGFIKLIHLFKKNKSQDSMGAKSEIVGGEAFPETKKSFVPNHSSQDILKSKKNFASNSTVKQITGY